MRGGSLLPVNGEKVDDAVGRMRGGAGLRR
jgi:hypothetical protein